MRRTVTTFVTAARCAARRRAHEPRARSARSCSVTYGTGPSSSTAITSLVARSRPTGRLEVVVVDNEHPTDPTGPFNTCSSTRPASGSCDPAGISGSVAGATRACERSTGRRSVSSTPTSSSNRAGSSRCSTRSTTGARSLHPCSASRTACAVGRPPPVRPTDRPPPITTCHRDPGDRPPRLCIGGVLADAAPSTFDELGGFDQAFFPAYYEDVDLALRAALARRHRGGRRVRVVHHRGASTE